MEWLSLFFEPLVFIGISLLTIIVLGNMNINIKYSSKFLYAVLVFYILVATPLGANYLVSRVEITTQNEICKNKNIDTVVILSGGVTGDPDSVDEIWRLKEASYRRTLSGLDLANNSKNSTIIVTGGYGGQFKESDLMEYLIKKIGFTGQIIKDGASKNTYSSAINVTKLLRENEVNEYWLVTSALHMHRAENAFLKQGIKPCRYPIDSKYIDISFPVALLPQISALDKSTAAFHEIVGFLWYLVSGKI